MSSCKGLGSHCNIYSHSTVVMDEQERQSMEFTIEQPDEMISDKLESNHASSNPVIAPQRCNHPFSTLAGSPCQKASTFTTGITSEQEAYLKRIRALTTIFAQGHTARRERECCLEGGLGSHGALPQVDDRSNAPLRMPLRSTEPSASVQKPLLRARPVSPSFWTLSEHTTDESSIELPLKIPSPRKSCKRLLPLLGQSTEPTIVNLPLGAVPSEISVTTCSPSSASTGTMSQKLSTVPSDVDRSRTETRLLTQRNPTGPMTKCKSKSDGALSIERRNEGGDPPFKEPGRWNLSGSQEDLAKLILQGKKNERKKVENAVRRLDDVSIGADQLAEIKALLMGGGSRKVTIEEDASVAPISTNRATSLPPVSFTRWKAITPLKGRERCTSGGSTTSNRSEDMSPMLQGAVAEHLLRNSADQRWLDSSSKRSNRSLKLPNHF